MMCVTRFPTLSLDFLEAKTFMMISRINKLLGAVVLISLTLYIVLTNREQAQVYLTDGHQYSAPLGVVLIATFILGTLCTAAVAAFFGLRLSLRERSKRAAERRKEQREKLYVEARSLRAGGDLLRAQRILEQLFRQGHNKLIVLLELIKVLVELGEHNEALRLVGENRPQFEGNTELILAAAQLHTFAGNKTAALDNLDLLLRSQANQSITSQAMLLAEELERYDDSLVYLEKLRAFGVDDRESAARIKFKKIMKEATQRPFPYREVKNLTKKYPEFSMGLRALAQEEEKNGNIKAAAQFFMRAAKQDNTFVGWKPAVDLWVVHNNPDNAVAASRTAIESLSGDDQFAAQLMLARVYLRFGMAEVATDLLESLKERQGEGITPSLLREFVLLRAATYSALGVREKFQESLSLLDGQSGHLSAVLELPSPTYEGDEAEDSSLLSPALSVS
jgi:uncharacterized integral membrane protein